jgi:predicted GNAT family acetyltransferase
MTKRIEFNESEIEEGEVEKKKLEERIAANLHLGASEIRKTGLAKSVVDTAAKKARKMSMRMSSKDVFEDNLDFDMPKINKKNLDML